jgi:transcription termination/antitermination protein NusG
MFESAGDRRWFALAVKPRHEKAVARNLQARGLVEFTPVYAARRSWSDRTTRVDVPLFPGYAFCHFGRAERFAAITTPGVMSVVGFGLCDVPVEDAEIESIRALLASGLPVDPVPYVRAGDPVRIEHGPLAGARGTVLRLKGSWRLVVNVELLQRSVAIEIDRGMARTDPALAGSPHVPEYSHGRL